MGEGREKVHRRFRVLAIDDQPDALRMLEVILGSEGFEVFTAQDALSGLRMAYQLHPDAVLLDVMMPEVDGFEVCRRLREMTDVPIVFVTARGTIEDVVRGFALGADDYVVKPFNRSELIGRLFACLRRAGEREDRQQEIMFPAASVMLDCGRHELVIGHRTVYLTPKEFEVLRFLIRHAGRVLSPDAILTRVWGPERVGEPDLVKQYIYRLRRKIEPDPKSPRYIRTVRGSGYYFDAEDLL
ncbi:MAG TPA: response regulator transcription factor [Anaerolineae bacterium]|nr:response regulator transcription factor [Anaerolineae bacterium]